MYNHWQRRGKEIKRNLSKALIKKSIMAIMICKNFHDGNGIAIMAINGDPKTLNQVAVCKY